MRSVFGRIGGFFLTPVLKITFRDSTRSRVLVHYKSKILLVKDLYGKQEWGLPGGGFKKNECKYCGAQREVKEEVGIETELDDYTMLGYINTITPNKIPYKAAGFSIEVKSDWYTIDRKEILEANWFELDSLPNDRLDIIDELLSLEKVKIQSNNTPL